jgi:hypothetical protein
VGVHTDSVPINGRNQHSETGETVRVSRPSLTTIIASLALFFALGGTAVAASHYLITSPAQIKPSVLSKLKGKPGAQGATGSQGVAGSQGATGPQGASGPAGPQGPAGPSNLSAITTVTGPTVEVENDKVKATGAECPAGERAVSGGGDGSISGLTDSEMETSHTSWFILVYNTSGITLKIHATVECAAAGQAVAARLPHPTHALMDRRVAELVAAINAGKH